MFMVCLCWLDRFIYYCPVLRAALFVFSSAKPTPGYLVCASERGRKAAIKICGLQRKKQRKKN